MKVLVLGGTRYFGRHLVHSLIKEGNNVWVLSRGQQADDFGARVHRLKADRRDKKSLAAAVEHLHFDAVVDQICMTAEDAAIACDVFANKTPYYIMTSTMSVYHFGSGLREEDFNPYLYQPQTPTNPAEEYAEGKRAAEHYFANHASFHWAFARYPVVVGEDDYTHRFALHVEKVQQEKPLYFPNLNARFSFVTSADAGKSLLWLLHGKHTGIFNFASPEPILLKEFIEEIEKVTGKKAVLSKERSDADWSPYGIPQDWYLNTEKAHAAGFQAQALSDWMRPLIEYFAKQSP
ncbi:NAD-dependent epimerase/dehydratase family protein [Bdellovibrio bacteriovorus]|nr:NAD-dependent epimerase/dehydratase family protein [Bdellovibrio bacteriovorus]